jgi:hypothetical protein
MERIFLTKNGNYLIEDTESYSRFVDAELNHLRWIHPDEMDFLRGVCTPVEIILVPEPREYPSIKTIWEHVTPPEDPDRSNNGGSYAFLHRVELYEGWDTDSFNGYYLVTNHLYGSDYSGQGWHTQPFESEKDAMAFIEGFKTVLPSA